MYCYTAYHLVIQSDLALPELTTCQGEADVTIRIGDGAQFAPGALNKPGYSFLSASLAAVNAPGTGLFVVRDGNDIIVSPAPNAEASVLRNLVITVSLNILLYQRGLFLLHASAVAANGVGIAFMGESGWGKSTIAASLQRRGYALVADDTLAADAESPGAPVVFPAFPQLKLLPGTLVALNMAPEELPRVHPFEEKRLHRPEQDFALTSLLLKRLYVLDRGEQNRIERIGPQDTFKALFMHSYAGHLSHLRGLNILAATGQTDRHLRHCAKIANAVPVLRLVRRWDITNLSALTALIEEDLAGEFQEHP
jgi:hypothetical protein